MTMSISSEYLKGSLSQQRLKELLRFLTVIFDECAFSLDGQFWIDHRSFNEKDVSLVQAEKIALFLLEETKIFSDVTTDERDQLGELGIKFEIAKGGSLELKNLLEDTRTCLDEKSKGVKKEGLACTPIFHFVEGILFRDHSDRILQFKEKTMEYALLRSAFNQGANSRLDSATPGLDDYNAEQIYKTAHRLNEKIKDEFGVEFFFWLDHTNKHVKKSVQ